MLISAADDIFACELGIFNLNIGKNLGVMGLGMVPFTGTSYIRKKNTEGLARRNTHVKYESSYHPSIKSSKLRDISDFKEISIQFYDKFYFSNK